MRYYLSVLFVLCLVIPAKSQIRSGTFQIDGDLNQINVSASADFGKFRSELSVGYNISEEKINYYHAELSMPPADIYFALEMSRASHRPIDDVVRIYKVKQKHGWGEIAKDLGIKPGSAEFHALKNKAVKKSGKYKENKGNKGGNKGNGNGKSKHK